MFGSIADAAAPLSRALPQAFGKDPTMNSAIPASQRTSNAFEIPKSMRAWVLGGPDELTLVEKPVPEPKAAEVLVRIDAIAVCATDIEIMRHGLPASVDGELPFNKGFTIGHEYMGTVVKLGPSVDEFQIGDRIAVEVHAGCGRCPRCREGMYTSCLNYGFREKGHRANGFTTDGGFAEYAVNNVNTLVHVPDYMSDAEATLIVTAGTAMYGLDVMGGIIAGESVVVMGPGPIGLMGAAVAKALGAGPSFSPAPVSGGSKWAANWVPTRRLTSTRRMRFRRFAVSPTARACNTCSNVRARPTLSTRRPRWSTGAAGFAWLPSRRTDAGRPCPAGPQQHLRLWHPR